MDLLHLAAQPLVFLPMLLLAFLAGVRRSEGCVVVVADWAARALFWRLWLATLGAFAEHRVFGEPGVGDTGDPTAVVMGAELRGLVLGALGEPTTETEVAGLVARVFRSHLILERERNELLE